MTTVTASRVAELDGAWAPAGLPCTGVEWEASASGVLSLSVIPTHSLENRDCRTPGLVHRVGEAEGLCGSSRRAESKREIGEATEHDLAGRDGRLWTAGQHTMSKQLRCVQLYLRFAHRGPSSNTADRSGADALAASRRRGSCRIPSQRLRLVVSMHDGISPPEQGTLLRRVRTSP